MSFHRIHCRFSSGNAPAFTATPSGTIVTVEGHNVTLEWKYNFGSTRSFRQLIFSRNSAILVDKFASDPAPYIDPAYTGRLPVNVTDTYTSITFLGVKRTDSTGYTLKLVSNKGRPLSQVEISVQCKYEKQTKQFIL